jgi:hypothetical protein
LGHRKGEVVAPPSLESQKTLQWVMFWKCRFPFECIETFLQRFDA